MPVFINDLTHKVAVRQSDDPRAPLFSLRPGRAKRVDGIAADELLETRGVRELTGQEAEDALEANRHRTGPKSKDIDTGNAVAKLHSMLGQLTVAVPLAVVVGDDAAPLGPPSGEVSTKFAEAAKDPEHRRAFAQNEALPGEHVPEHETPQDGPSVSQVHNAQVDSSEAVQEIAATFTDDNVSAPQSNVPEGISEDMSAERLRDEADNRGLAKSGTKAELVEAILAYDAEHADSSDDE